MTKPTPRCQRYSAARCRKQLRHVSSYRRSNHQVSLPSIGGIKICFCVMKHKLDPCFLIHLPQVNSSVAG